MKLNSALVERTLTQFDAQAIPENHPVVHQLNSLFGDHTFFLDANGLNIVEPTAEGNSDAPTANVVKLADHMDFNPDEHFAYGMQLLLSSLKARSNEPCTSRLRG